MRLHNFTSCSWMLFDVIVDSAKHHIADLLIITTQVTPAAVPKGKKLKHYLYKQHFTTNWLWEHKYKNRVCKYFCFHDSSSTLQSICFATGWKGKTDERCKGYCPVLLLARAAREQRILKKWREGSVSPLGLAPWTQQGFQGDRHYLGTAFQGS